MAPTINYLLSFVCYCSTFCQLVDCSNKTSLLLSCYASSMATLASKALLFSWVFLPLRRPSLCQRSYNHCFFAINIEFYSSLEYFFNSIFPLKVILEPLVFCFFAEMDAALTLDFGPHLSMYCVRNVTTALKSFSYLSG